MNNYVIPIQVTSVEYKELLLFAQSMGLTLEELFKAAIENLPKVSELYEDLSGFRFEQIEIIL